MHFTKLFFLYYYPEFPLVSKNDLYAFPIESSSWSLRSWKFESCICSTLLPLPSVLHLTSCHKHYQNEDNDYD